MLLTLLVLLRALPYRLKALVNAFCEDSKAFSRVSNALDAAFKELCCALADASEAFNLISSVTKCSSIRPPSVWELRTHGISN